MESRKGMRQPQAWKAAAFMLCCVAIIATSERTKPRLAVIWMKPV
jgi:hypothetical protein